jgi:hypothetical protein
MSRRENVYTLDDARDSLVAGCFESGRASVYAILPGQTDVEVVRERAMLDVVQALPPTIRVKLPLHIFGHSHDSKPAIIVDFQAKQ